MMSKGFTRQQERELVEALGEGGSPTCPECGGELLATKISPSESVAYVRRRIWFVCSGCRRSVVTERR